MKRRDLLLTTGAAALGLSAFPLRWVAAGEKKKQTVLYFTRSAGYVHDVVNRRGQELAYSEKILTELGQKNGLEVVCSQDPSVFDGDLDRYNAFIFYISGNPFSDQAKEKLLAAIKAGKGFVGLHSATDGFRSKGVDPYIAMLGGEFVTHGAQQKATMRVTSPEFPGMAGLGRSFQLLDEWYSLQKFAPDLHVLLVQETAGMTGPMYQRPPYPETWARLHGKGRVFYTSMGHREDVWTGKIFEQILMGGIAWTLGNVQADVTPNIAKVTPKANQLKN
jgi:type 1 glutamine amidotransferase